MDPNAIAAVFQLVARLLTQLQGSSASDQLAYIKGVNDALDALARVSGPDEYAPAAQAIADAIAGKSKVK